MDIKSMFWKRHRGSWELLASPARNSLGRAHTLKLYGPVAAATVSFIRVSVSSPKRWLVITDVMGVMGLDFWMESLRMTEGELLEFWSLARKLELPEELPDFVTMLTALRSL